MNSYPPSNQATWLHTKTVSSPCTIIAEVGQNHDGSLGTAHAFIDAAARAGADAIKFQTHIAAAESTPNEPWRTQFSKQDKTRMDYWRRMEFTLEQWQGLKDHATDKDLLFLSSPFSIEAIELLNAIGVAGWKLASGEINNYLLIDEMLKSKLPIIISTGLSDLDEIDEIISYVMKKKVPTAVLQCTTMYPCPPSNLGLNVIAEFRNRYACAVGLSDHSASIYSGLAAASMGIEVLEVHVTLSKEMFGPDISSSITIDELQQLVRGVRYIETIRSHPVDKLIINESAMSLREIFTKSIVATEELPAGLVIEKKHLNAKKPGSGLSTKYISELVGARLKRKIQKDEMILLNDIETE